MFAISSQTPTAMTDRTIKVPDFPKSWGPFLAYTAAISLSAFGFASMARTETGIIVVGTVAAVAMIVGLIARLRHIV
jgi:hypothetical protein